ncbi:MAG: LptF/LptG family permease [Chitinophagaceae bacterium]
MFKKLDILVIRAFIGPFLATFLLAIFILTLQFFWLYIDDMVGKGLNFTTFIKLIGLVVLHGFPLAMPIAMLLSSIMTFGNLGETFEIVAIKSAGISLLRFMKPLLYVAVIITIFTFLCLNYFIPVAELKLEALKHDIIVAQPALDIKEGVFYNKLNGYVVRVGKKENDSIIKNIVIFEKNNTLQDYIITAERGVMRVSPNKKFLEFTLYNGWRVLEKGYKGAEKTDFIRMGFKEYKKLLDLSSLQMNKTKEEVFQKNARMLSIRQIDKNLDSVNKQGNIYEARSKIELLPYLNFLKYRDTGWTNIPLKKSAKAFVLPDSVKRSCYEKAANSLSIARSLQNTILGDYKMRNNYLLSYKIEWQKRFTLSLACFVMFLIGAPLGSIIRKGGLGTPLIFAIAFFVLFHLLNTFGERFSKEEVMKPIFGIWLSIYVLIPIATFLLVKAMKDSQLFNNEYYFRVFGKWRSYFFKKSKKMDKKQDIAETIT